MSEVDAARRLSNGAGFADAFAALRPSPRFVRFLCTGLVNTLFGYTVFLVALWCGAGAGGALVTSTVTGTLFNFQTSRRIVFRSRAKGLLLRFACVYAIVLALNYMAIVSLKQVGLPSWAAQACLLLPMALVAFALQRGFVFTGGGRAA